MTKVWAEESSVLRGSISAGDSDDLNRFMDHVAALFAGRIPGRVGKMVLTPVYDDHDGLADSPFAIDFEVQTIPTSAPEPNEPMTFEELQEMVSGMTIVSIDQAVREGEPRDGYRVFDQVGEKVAVLANGRRVRLRA